MEPLEISQSAEDQDEIFVGSEELPVARVRISIEMNNGGVTRAE